jgi:hypothetical protein
MAGMDGKPDDSFCLVIAQATVNVRNDLTNRQGFPFGLISMV